MIDLIEKDVNVQRIFGLTLPRSGAGSIRFGQVFDYITFDLTMVRGDSGAIECFVEAVYKRSCNFRCMFFCRFCFSIVLKVDLQRLTSSLESRRGCFNFTGSPLVLSVGTQQVGPTIAGESQCVCQNEMTWR